MATTSKARHERRKQAAIERDKLWREQKPKSPLTYFGGKGSHIEKILPYLPKAHTLVEPFAGGGSVFIAANYPESIINDFDRGCATFWRAILDDEWLLNNFPDWTNPDDCHVHFECECERQVQSVTWDNFDTWMKLADGVPNDPSYFFVKSRYVFNGIIGTAKWRHAPPWPTPDRPRRRKPAVVSAGAVIDMPAEDRFVALGSPAYDGAAVALPKRERYLAVQPRSREELQNIIGRKHKKYCHEFYSRAKVAGKNGSLNKMWRVRQTYNGRVKIFNLDFEEVPVPENSVIYADPPYVEEGDNYRAGKNFDHARLAKWLKAQKVPWVLSYDNHELIRELYTDCQIVEWEALYTSNLKGTRKKKTELLILGGPSGNSQVRNPD
jgi:DNA adenine methylase